MHKKTLMNKVKKNLWVWGGAALLCASLTCCGGDDTRDEDSGREYAKQEI